MLAPGSNIGRYVVKRRLAEGGMAEVYLAQAVGPEGFAKDVVIKVVRSFLSSDQQFIDMFINEARLSSRLNHANVVQIFDFGKHEESYFIAMEYVRGASLFDLRKRCRDRSIPFPPTLVAEIGAQVARGLQYAHSLMDKGKPLGIVHRDVTPHNVLLSFDGAVKLTDFGIAKASTTHTAPGVLKGKFAYMSPEQARGDVVDARTDIFALGVVLWEMLTGGRLFDGDSELAVLRAVQESLIAPPSRLNPDVPHELSDLILKALSRPLHERFQTAFEFEKALATFVLRAAKSVEDSSVSLFLQQVYRDELEAEDRPMTPLGVPAVQRGVVPQASSFGSGDTLAVDRSRELARGRATPPGELEDPPTDEGPAKTAPQRGPVSTEPFAPTHQREALTVPKGPRTDSMPALASQKTDQLKALEPASSRTDQVPALRPAGEGTDVFGPSRPPPPDKRTDPERSPLGANSNGNSGVKLSPSMQLDVKRAAERVGAPPVAAEQANDPTVLKPRAIALALEPSAPTAAAAPTGPKRSPAVLVGSVAAGVLVLAVGGYAVLSASGKDPGPTGQPTVVTPTPVTAPAALTKPPEPPAVAKNDAPSDPRPDATPPVEPPAPDAPVVAPALKPVALDEPVDAGAPVPVVAKPEPKPAAVRTGLLNVKAIPFAEVVIDGRKSGEVQGTRTLKLPVGKHKVTLVHPKRSESFEVTIDGKAAAEIGFNANR